MREQSEQQFKKESEEKSGEQAKKGSEKSERAVKAESILETTVRNLAGDLNLPRDVVLGDALISFIGRCGVTVENYRGILLYERELVKLSARNCRIVIRGKNLRIDYYTSEQMHISGQIVCMEFEG
ncbi:YabP/YqfC family sporulation protein [Brotaphodocola sp.]|uniref:YabP/YqfC family sporulation protein n=1 Tax=Brotaphodocola sp. TaxID=3073577 RepID=UPI003D7EABD0